MSANRVIYRPDIDGPRAIAVVSVVLCHAGLGVSGGYVGVDVFFVISGIGVKKAAAVRETQSFFRGSSSNHR
jgi:peptidoglycan/LPS O-acetylase OafA/YrhL